VLGYRVEGESLSLVFSIVSITRLDCFCKRGSVCRMYLEILLNLLNADIQHATLFYPRRVEKHDFNIFALR
jgi:hypothetical protein